MADALFFGAHPDDLEILAGGLIARMASEGRDVVMVDATAGEMGTRGTPAERATEAAEAARILGARRMTLGLPDGAIAANPERATRAAVEAIRLHRPRLVITHSPGDHHPDHNALAIAVHQAFFLANVLKYPATGERHRPARLLYFWSRRDLPPPPGAFVADVSAHWPRKLDAIRAHQSQVFNPAYKGPATFVSSEQFWWSIEATGAYFGSLVGVRHGEAYLPASMLRIDDPLALPDVESVP